MSQIALISTICWYVYACRVCILYVTCFHFWPVSRDRWRCTLPKIRRYLKEGSRMQSMWTHYSGGTQKLLRGIPLRVGQAHLRSSHRGCLSLGLWLNRPSGLGVLRQVK